MDTQRGDEEAGWERGVAKFGVPEGADGVY